MTLSIPLTLSCFVFSHVAGVQDAAASHPAQIRILDKPLCDGQISPFQYGQFVEYLCTLIPSMWAERLYDGSFEGLSPYKVAYLHQTDFREKPWYPSGATNRAEYSLDKADPISGEVSQKIAARGDTACTVGISQDGVFVDRNEVCIFTCYLKAKDVHGPIRVAIHHEGKTYAACEFMPTKEWKKFRSRLVASARDVNTTVTISFRGPGTLWIDSVSLMPEKTVGGWRPDAVEAVRALKPGVIRFGGSALDDASLGDFSWRDTLGDPDRRRPFRAWGGLQPAGAGLEEIVQFCRQVGAEPLICVRFTRRGPKDAADQVQYFNGSVDTPMGQLRARNGHPEPYHICYWQVGNERAGAEYETQLAEFCRAMKGADPTIQLLSSYPSEGVLRNAGRWLEYVCPHHYACADLDAMQKDIDQIRRLLARYAPGHNIKIGVTEWNTTAGDWGPRRGMLWTLANALACARYHNLLHRNCDIVEIANRSNLINSFCSGIIQTDNHRLYCTPTYYAQQLYATLAGNRSLAIAPPTKFSDPLDISATLTATKDAVVLFAVNDSLKEIECQIDLSAFRETHKTVSAWKLTDTERAGEPDVTNTFSAPQRIAPVASQHTANGAVLSYHFPPLSLTVLRWPIRK
jgi:alpha-N-arabinofuranosidase